MKVRLLAGIGMFLLAAGMLTIFFMTEGHLPSVLSVKETPDQKFGIPTIATPVEDGPADVSAFLEEYNATYRRLWTEYQGSRWNGASNINETHLAAELVARKNLDDFLGSREIIEKLRLIRGRLDLTELQDRQVEMAWRLASYFPQTVKSTADQLLQTESALADSFSAFEFRIAPDGADPQQTTRKELEHTLALSRDPKARLAIWEACQMVGPKLKDDLIKTQGLRNSLAHEMGFSSFFGLEMADYGLTSQQSIQMMDEILAGIMPLYEQLHCWVKYELADRFEIQEVPRRIPAHWLNDPWSEQWSGIVESTDMDNMFRNVQPQWIIEQGERFFTSFGFSPLPLTFWGRSDLFILPPDAQRHKKASPLAIHMDLDQDVRALMNVESNFSWFQTTHEQLGQIYYYLAYSREEVPPILRQSPTKAFNGGFESLIQLSSSQVPYLQQLGLLSTEETPEIIRQLLSEALQGPIVFLPYACGTLGHWQYDVYEKELPRHLMNTRWWEYAARYQGIEPPAPRGEDSCDPAAQNNLGKGPNWAYESALGTVIGHQLHRFVCQKILKQDVWAANYFGDRKVGMFLHSILQLGATRDWQVMLQQATGEDLSSEALAEYYEPLLVWLTEQNAGREVGF